MYKLLIAITSIFIISSCTGEDGIDGLDGVNIEASVFEVNNVNFISENGLSATKKIVVDSNVNILETDVPLVFVLDPEATADNGGLEVWEPLPRIFFFEDGGQAQFRFNFIFDESTNIFDLDITLESNDFDALGSTFTDNQTFRIAIVPAFNVSNFSAQASSLLQTMDNSEIILLD